MNSDPSIIGVIGSGSWATALIKILTDNGNRVLWWIRNAEKAEFIKSNRHNPDYLSSVEIHTDRVNYIGYPIHVELLLYLGFGSSFGLHSPSITRVNLTQKQHLHFGHQRYRAPLSASDGRLPPSRTWNSHG